MTNTKPKQRAKILVCGGRDFGSLPTRITDFSKLEEYKQKAANERLFFSRVMDASLKIYDIECIVQGGAKGADRLAKEWAELKGLPQEEYKADWSLGRKAGILRNAEMLELSKPTLVIAFAGGVGTKDMVTRSRKAGVRVIEAKL